jgi:hypothetical protein
MRGLYFRLLSGGILLFGIMGLAQAQLVYETGRGDGQPNYQLCKFDTFGQPNECYMTKFFADPFTVRRVKGTIISQAGPWPEGVLVLFEIRAKAGDATVRQATSNEQGEISVPDLPPGEYCFRAMVKGWQTVAGLVTVSEKAPRNAKLSFEMSLDTK